jgi:hypothetical protein
MDVTSFSNQRALAVVLSHGFRAPSFAYLTLTVAEPQSVVPVEPVAMTL